ncbi:hypothetical protein JYU34_022774 [Plutella xylostella]|uniref:Uncharacterized protein n=1 Tax=Plutella xylostella TaxID=51655 RepID=A0ABQ7PT62_PLUXY|nr:hypothetical protein JYU34_022774 [Plutella xylostella]
MKRSRHRPDKSTRAPSQDSATADGVETQPSEDECPPAKKLLKNLLAHEVDKAMRQVKRTGQEVVQQNANAGCSPAKPRRGPPAHRKKECDRFKVTTANKECLPPGASIIKVLVLGNKSGNEVATPPRHFELNGVSYSLPATVLRGAEGYMKVVNTGNEEIVWQPGEVLARAENCQELSSNSQVV